MPARSIGRWRSFAAAGRAAVRFAVVAPLLLAGCITSAVWNELPKESRGVIDWTDGGTITAIVITPITLTLDVALGAGGVWLIVQGGQHGLLEALFASGSQPARTR